MTPKEGPQVKQLKMNPGIAKFMIRSAIDRLRRKIVCGSRIDLTLRGRNGEKTDKKSG